MFTRTFECPSCGAPIPRNHPGTKTLVCTHCGQTSHLMAESLEAAGEKHLLLDYGSILQIGQQLSWNSESLLVLGRLRMNYEDGFWDEWFAQNLDDGSERWIQEDDGSFVLFSQQKEFSKTIDWDSVKVGSTTDFLGEWEPVFITSKSKASIDGGEGELPFRITPGEPADFIDGIWKGKPISLELLPDNSPFFVGIPIEAETFLKLLQKS